MSFPVSGRLRRAAVAALALSFISLASAEIPVYSENLSHIESASRHAEDKLSAGGPVDVDLFTGTVSLSMRDVHVPGNGGLDIVRTVTARWTWGSSWSTP